MPQPRIAKTALVSSQKKPSSKKNNKEAVASKRAPVSRRSKSANQPKSLRAISLNKIEENNQQKNDSALSQDDNLPILAPLVPHNNVVTQESTSTAIIDTAENESV